MSKTRGASTTANSIRQVPSLSNDYATPAVLPEADVSSGASRGLGTRGLTSLSDATVRKTAPRGESDEAVSQPRLKLASTGDDHAGKITVSSTRHPEFPLVTDQSNTVAAESFSVLRSRLLAVHNRLGLRSFVITSAETGDGKTLIATNLALSLGQLGGKRTLLVDGDLRIATVTKVFNLKQALGLSDFLQGSASFDAVMRETQTPALAVVPAGTASKKLLAELLQGPRWPEFLAKAKEDFDIVVVDTIPISAPVVDFELLTEACDAVLVVVRMRQTNRQALKRVASRVDAKKFLGVIVNNADEIYDYDYGYVDKK